MSNTSSSSGGIGFCGLLTIVFITLKLTGYIDWSWWWVLAPIWIPVTLVVVIMLVCCVCIFLYYFIKELIAQRKRKNKRKLDQKKWN